MLSRCVRRFSQSREDAAVVDLTARLLKKQPPVSATVPVGNVKRFVNGVALVDNLNDTHIGSLVSLHSRTTKSRAQGVVLSVGTTSHVGLLDSHLSDSTFLQNNDEVRSEKDILRFPVGPAVLGRVVSPTGDPLDGKGPLKPGLRLPLLVPKTTNITPATGEQHFLHTGIQQIDLFHPIAHGSRVVLAGPSKTGKSKLVMEIIKNRVEGLALVYVMCGKKQPQIDSVVNQLQRTGLLESSTIIATSPEDPLTLQYLAPLAGCILGGFLRDSGMRAVVIFDELATQATHQINLGKIATANLVPSPTNIHALITSQCMQLPQQKYGGSFSAFILWDSQLAASAPESTGKQEDTLRSMVDYWIDFKLSKSLQRLGSWPPIELSHAPARFQPKVTRKIYSQLMVALREHRDLKQQLEMAKELGIEDEVLDEELKHFGGKFNLLLTQDPGENISLAQLILTLYLSHNSLLSRLPPVDPSKRDPDTTRKFLQFRKGIVAYAQQHFPAVLTQLEAVDANTELSPALEADILSLVQKYEDQFSS